MWSKNGLYLKSIHKSMHFSEIRLYTPSLWQKFSMGLSCFWTLVSRGLAPCVWDHLFLEDLYRANSLGRDSVSLWGEGQAYLLSSRMRMLSFLGVGGGMAGRLALLYKILFLWPEGSFPIMRPTVCTHARGPLHIPVGIRAHGNPCHKVLLL